MEPRLPRPDKRSNCGNGGFSLIELIISIVLLGLLAAVGANMLSDSFDIAYMLNTSQSTASQARYTLERLEREIRETQYTGGAYTIVGTPTGTSFKFTKADGVTVTIANSGSDLTIGYSDPTTISTDPVTTSTLTSQVVTLGNPPLLAYYKNDGVTETTSGADIRFVEIKLTLRGPSKTEQQDIVLRTRVALRNG